jgi:hypothetical protein
MKRGGDDPLRKLDFGFDTIDQRVLVLTRQINEFRWSHTVRYYGTALLTISEKNSETKF